MDNIELDLCIRNFKRTGDNSFFEKIYRHFFPKILRFTALNVNEVQNAEDIASEVFIKAYRYIRKLNLNAVNLKPWLYKVARNLVIDFYRKEARKGGKISLDQYLEEKSAADHINEEIIDKALVFEKDLDFEFNQVGEEKIINAELLKNLNTLTEIQKQVIILRFVEDLDHKSIGRIVNKNEIAVRAISFRAISKLRELKK